jgi:hypothetical protein
MQGLPKGDLEACFLFDGNRLAEYLNFHERKKYEILRNTSQFSYHTALSFVRDVTLLSACNVSLSYINLLEI